MSGPPDYDPRRLFPFGLSPIPEVPSELASEVSSMYSYACDDEEESEAETEVEGAKTPGSIMYSGSCSSVKSNGTLEDKAQADDDSTETETEEEDSEYSEDGGNQVIIEARPTEPDAAVQSPDPDPILEKPIEDEQELEEESSEESESSEEEEEPGVSGNHYSSCVTAVTHQKRAFQMQTSAIIDEGFGESGLAIVPSASSSNLDPSPGAIAATEIFQHLQATRGKNEVTTELAKILNVLQTTLKEDSSSSSSSSCETEESDDSKETTPERAVDKPNQSSAQAMTSSKAPPLGKPPVYPQALRGTLSKKVGPEIQQRIKELASLRPEKGREEMSILSKILVTLLCSCKSAEATAELRKIIRHFREAANEASDEVEEEIKPLLRSSRTSSRGSKRRYRSRSRRSSANSNGSNTSQSEAESLTNTLTPCNTDSKSSGTEDEGMSGPAKRCSVCNTPTNEDLKRSSVEKEREIDEANVTFTVSLPRRPSIEVAEITASISPTKMILQAHSNQSSQDIDQDEQEEDEEEEWEWEEDEDTASRTSRASRRGKRVDSTSSRDLSSAELQKDASMASSTRKLLTEMEFGAYNSDSVCSPGHTSGQSDGVSMSEQSHASPALGDSDSNMDEGKGDDIEEEEDDEEEDEEEEEENLYTHLEETYRVLNGAYQIITGAQTEIAVHQQESMQTSVEEPMPVKTLLRPPSRPSSKMSRPASRRSVQKGEDANEDGEDWEDDEEGDWEWEYYYEDENGEEQGEDRPPVEAKEVSPPGPVQKTFEVKPEAASAVSRPTSRQRKVPISRPGSRTGSKAGSRPSSRTSKKDGSLGGVQEEDGDDWEWEYYYEEDEEVEEDELGRLSPAATTAPTTRATSPFPDQQQAIKKLLKHGEQCIEPAWQMETTAGKYIGLPSYARAFESFHNDPDWYNPVKELSVALAAQYLGQRSEEVVKSLPADFASSQCGDKSEKGSSSANRSIRKKNKKHGSGDEGDSKGSEEKKKKRRKKRKGDGKFLPKITVRDLVNMLEPQLFKDDDTGTKMVMQEEVARCSIAKQKTDAKVKEVVKQEPVVEKSIASSLQNQVEEPIKKEVVIIHDPKNPHQVEVCMDGQSTFVTMRPHSRRSLGAKSKDSTQKDSKKNRKNSGISKDSKPHSPSDSEAYGTGSSVSEALDNIACHHGSADDPSREDQPSRHSRLLKILQESEESDCFPASSGATSDHDSIGSLPATGGVAVERKLSFRSIKSSGRESDGDSISSELKSSPPVLRRPTSSQHQQVQQYATATQRLMNLSLQSCYNMDSNPPSSSEISTPSSPGYLDYTQFGSLERRKRMSAPTTPSSFSRMWEEAELDDIMKRKLSSTAMVSPLARTLQESRLMGGGSSSPLMMNSHSMRNSPVVPTARTQSPSYRHSPKLEQELLELGNLPPPTQYPSLPRNYSSRGSNK